MFLQPIQMWGNLKDNGLKDVAENKHQKTTLSKLQQSFKKKGGKQNQAISKNLDKIIWKQNTVGAAPQTWGLSVVSDRSAQSHSRFCKTMIHYVALEWEIPHRRKRLRPAERAGFCLFASPPEDGSHWFPLTDWVSSEGVKNGSHKVCSKSPVWGGDAPVKWEDKMWFPYEFIWA